MSKIEELIAKYCPDGVEYSKLENIATVDTGTQLNKELLFDDGRYPVMNGGIYPSGRYNEYNTKKIVSPLVKVGHQQVMLIG